jgi:hypothetical protein
LRGRIWLILGVIVGIAVALGHLPYLAGAGRSLADTTQRLVASASNHIIHDLASAGAPRRLVLGLSAVIAVLLPGVAALLLVAAARASMYLRSVVALLIVALGASSFLYQPHGKAAGVLLLSLVVAGLAVALTGPLVAAPLAGVASLIGAEYLPSLILSHRHITQVSVEALHEAIFAKSGDPFYLQLVLLIVAALPFLVASRLILRR